MTNEQRLERLRAKAEGMGLQIGILHRTFNDNQEWVDGELHIEEPNLPDEGDGGFYRTLAVFNGPKAPDTAERLLASLAPGPVLSVERDVDLNNEILQRNAYNCHCPFCCDEVMNCSRECNGLECIGEPPVDENGKLTHEWRMCLLPVGEEVE